MKNLRMCKLTLAELDELRLRIETDPANRMPPDSFYIYTRQARKKLSDLAWAVTHKLKK